MTPGELKARTHRFALDVAHLLRSLPGGVEGQIVGSQLFRAATSIASNYRAGCRARSRREFIAKLGVVIEETDESDFWLQLCVDLELLDLRAAQKLRKEAGELLAIFTSSRKTAQARLSKRTPGDG